VRDGSSRNRIPFPKPATTDASEYELLVRVLEAGWRQTFHKFDLLPNRKTDTNNHGPFSFDNIGMNYDYPEASYERRREIIQEHRDYQQGLLWFLANDPPRPGRRPRRSQPLGTAQGRVQGQRPLAASDLRPRSPPHGRPPS
jgi:hypothetical protein